MASKLSLSAAAVHLKAVTLLLLVHCCSFRVAVLDLYYTFLLPFYFGNHLVEEKRAGCFTLIVFLLYCVCLCLCSYVSSLQCHGLTCAL